MLSINLDLNYFGHPKTRRLVRLLGRGSEVIPIRLWCFCGKHFSETARLTGIAAQEIESEVQWWGKEGECVGALIKCGFLDEVEGVYTVHDFIEHSGHLGLFKRKYKLAAQRRLLRGSGGCIQDQNSQLVSVDSNSEGVRGSGKGDFAASTLPCHNPQFCEDAKKIQEHYRKTVKPLAKTYAIDDIIAILRDSGLTVDDLIRSVDNYARSVASQQPRHRQSVSRFFKDSTFMSHLEAEDPNDSGEIQRIQESMRKHREFQDQLAKKAKGG